MNDAHTFIDTHVHLWDPGRFDYDWLADLDSLRRAFVPEDYHAATGGLGVAGMVFVECGCRPAQALAEAEWVASLATAEPRLLGIVAAAGMTDAALAAQLEQLAAIPLVRGVRHNIQGTPAGTALQPAFLEGVRRVGQTGMHFEICISHLQMPEAIELVRRCPETFFVLDHCGKPGIRDGLHDPWRAQLRELAGCANVACKISGLLTEADWERWTVADLRPYVMHVAECFGADRLLFGGDWPVVTLAGEYDDWHQAVSEITADWSQSERRALYRDNARRIYRLS